MLGGTYHPDFKNPANVGVAILFVEKYRAALPLFVDCGLCISATRVQDGKDTLIMDSGMLDCTGGTTTGGI